MGSAGSHEDPDGGSGCPPAPHCLLPLPAPYRSWFCAVSVAMSISLTCVFSYSFFVFKDQGDTLHTSKVTPISQHGFLTASVDISVASVSLWVLQRPLR